MGNEGINKQVDKKMLAIAEGKRVLEEVILESELDERDEISLIQSFLRVSERNFREWLSTQMGGRQ